MSNVSKNLLLGSMIASGLVALAAIVDLILAVPLGGKMVMDIMFVLSAAIVLYMGYDSYKELS